MPFITQKAEQVAIDFSKCNKVTIGADPELMFQYRGAKVNATNVFEGRENNGAYNAKVEGGTMGTDHNGRVAEVRPRHAVHPKELVENIQKTFAKSVLEFPALLGAEWLAGARKHGETIGGQVHFGIAMEVWENWNLTMAMDMFLACPFLLLEPAEEARQRKAGTQYGKLGDIRPQTWGTEYRPLASWIHSPALTLAALSLAKHIVNQAVLNPEFFKNLKNERPWGVDFETLKRKYAYHETEFFRGKVNEIWNIIMSWPIQPEVAEGLEIFKTMIDKNYTFGHGDFKNLWGLDYTVEKNGANAVKLTEIFGG